MAQKLTGISSKPTLNHCPSASHKFLPSDHEAFFLFSFVFYQLVQYYVLPGRTQFQEFIDDSITNFRLIVRTLNLQTKGTAPKNTSKTTYNVRTSNVNLVKKPNNY